MAEVLPFIIPAVGSLGAAGINYAGNSSAANTQANAANNASQAGLQGTREGIQAQKDIYNADRQREYEAAQYLKGLLPNLDMNTPDPQNYFGQGNVNQFYDLSKTNLNQQYQRDLGNAGQGAAELAAGRGLLNPSLLSRQAQNDVRQTYAPQFTGLEANRAGAMLQNNKDLYQALFQNENYMNMLRQLGYTNQFNLASNFGNPNIAPTPLSAPTNDNTPKPIKLPDTNVSNNMAYARYYTGGGRTPYDEWLKSHSRLINSNNNGGLG